MSSSRVSSAYTVMPAFAALANILSHSSGSPVVISPVETSITVFRPASVPSSSNIVWILSVSRRPMMLLKSCRSRTRSPRVAFAPCPVATSAPVTTVFDTSPPVTFIVGFALRPSPAIIASTTAIVGFAVNSISLAMSKSMNRPLNTFATALRSSSRLLVNCCTGFSRSSSRNSPM